MHLRNEYVLKVVGTVDQRPEGNENPLLDTGEIEVTATEVEVLSAAAPLPFQLDEHTEVGEETRLRYRYLDLRRQGDRKSTRLNSSHVAISYAVFCLKKKKLLSKIKD